MAVGMRQQRRGMAIAMTPSELDEFLATQRTCRVATVGSKGRPHVAPLWFAWDGVSVWLYSIVKSQRWTDIAHNPQVALVIDAGEQYGQLRGVEVLGKATVVDEVPHHNTADESLHKPQQLFARKYLDTDQFVADGRHGWLRVDVEKLTSWDFRKLADLATIGGNG